MSGSTIAIETAVPPSVAFDFVADPRNEISWNPSAQRIELLSDLPVGTGSAFRVFGRMMGREVVVELQIVELDPPRRTRTRASSGPMRFDTTYVVEPSGSGASVAMAVQVTANGPLRLLRPLLQAGFNRRAAPLGAR
jgi:carbon monoxide dehydrogenase subunit G